MTKSKPLTGIRVLDFSAYISGPYAGSLLCALGAEVVKIEPPKGGDAFRRGAGESSPYFVQYNSGKKSVAINLKDPEGVALVKSLLPKFDVLLENYRPGKLASLGLGADACREINPKLIYASVTGFGSGGPMRDRPAYDTIGQSMGGLYAILNDAGEPRLTGTCMADLMTAISTTMGILAALVGRERDPDRAGCVMETSILEATSLLTIDAFTQMGEIGQSPVRDSRHPQAQNFCLKTATGESMAIHLSSSQKFWENLLRAVERTDLLEEARFATYADRMEHFQELQSIFGEEFAKRSYADLEQALTRADAPFARVMTLETLSKDPQMQWLELLEDRGPVSLVRPPWRFFGERPTRSVTPPKVGQHTRDIATEVLSPEEVQRLADAGTIAL